MCVQVFLSSAGSTGSITCVPQVLTKLQYRAEDCSAIKCGEKTKTEGASEIEKEVVGVRPIQMFENSCWPVSTSAADFDSENDDWLEIQSCDETFPGGK